MEIVKVSRENTIAIVEGPGHKEHKVARLTPIKANDQTFQLENPKIINIPGGPQNGKTLRIIDYFPLPHEDIMKLMEFSESETLITGNQSFGEAVSASKTFFYEKLPNDNTFGEQISNLAGRIDPQFKSIVESMQGYEGQMDHEKIATAFKDPHTRQLFQAYGATVQNEFDLSKRLQLKVKRTLVSNDSPLIKKELEKVNKVITELSSTPKSNKPTAIDADQYENAVGQLYNPLSSIVSTVDLIANMSHQTL
ncbi:MAG: hypothetical protein H0T62_12280 [Parachlamydiaceae bacterium]|nr:hypothetical protein [Parachlamydiaceae bacterium]